MANARTIRIGTRASQLATWQANWVAAQLRRMQITVEIVPVRTSGDASHAPIVGGGSVGVFTREIQTAVCQHDVDIAVHSLKDLPTATAAGLRLAAIPLRASPFDVLVSTDGHSLPDLPRNSRLGTGSPRRQAQLKLARPDLRIESIRGNVDTRLRKLDEGQYDAIVLAEAGLIRLGWEDRISQTLPPEICLPAPGQGALGIEVRQDDLESYRIVRQLNDPQSESAVGIERSFLAAMEAGCSAPVGAWCRVESSGLVRLDIAIVNSEATQRIQRSFEGSLPSAIALGEEAAQWAIEQGAADWL